MQIKQELALSAKYRYTENPWEVRAPLALATMEIEAIKSIRKSKP